MSDSPTDRGAPSPSPTPRSTTGSILRALTFTQNASALVFGTFLTLHIAAPVAAAAGGLSAADGIMVLGREVYLPLEPVLVYAPLGLHLGSSLIRRAILFYRTRRLPTLSTHSLMGMALVPLVIPHLMLHRLIPAETAPPIAALSPSEFGFEFVAHAVATRPWMAVGYLALTAVGLYHATVGSMKVANWLKRLFGNNCEGHAGEARAEAKAKGEVPTAKIPRKRRIGLRGILATVVGIVGVGLYRLSTEAGGTSLALNNRFEAVFAAAPWTVIGLK